MKQQANYVEKLNEIIDYCKTNEIISYYAIKKYAYENREDWIFLFKDNMSRLVISDTTKSIKNKLGAKYDQDYVDALIECQMAVYDYVIKSEEDNSIRQNQELCKMSEIMHEQYNTKKMHPN